MQMNSFVIPMCVDFEFPILLYDLPFEKHMKYLDKYGDL